MTRDIDLVVEFFLKDVTRIVEVLGDEYYVSPEAAREAVLHQTSFNAIHHATLLKVEDFEVWVVSKEDLILSKLDWARESLSQRQLSDAQNLIATGCDAEYLREWSAKLNLTDMLTRVFP